MKLAEIAGRLGCELRGNGDVEISGMNSIDDAQPHELTFVANKKYLAKLATTKAAAVLLAPTDPDIALPSLRTPNPYLAFAQVLAWFHPPYTPPVGIHPTAVIAPSARLGASAFVGPYAVIGENVVIGDNARIFAHVVIYPNVQIGHAFTAHAGVVIREGTTIGDRVILQGGVVIGGDGFGYVPLPDGSPYKIPQTGTVTLADDVEIGANTTIDRAAMGTTMIRRGAKLDNLVMVGHGCDVGEGALLAAQVGLSGSTKLESGVRMGGQVGAAGHLTVGKNTMVAAQSGIPHDVPANSVVGGYPAVDIMSWRRYSAALPKLPELMRRIRRLEHALQANEEARGKNDE
ncbi:MAG: UDP-3-O-(3-hydroxymyristoyl)glucosamine N-acyltransferase [Deltaproteobacteria bacterium]|nr:UDP-3-O-(3-hydroxymyristoyl)glucosamine N-acyltransferase [Deltaproteobacteria bacterium]